MIKKIVLYIINTLSVLLIIGSLFVLLTVVMTKSGDAPNVLGYSVFRVLSGSMEPTIPVDSLVVVKRVEAEKIKEDDVISFYSQDPSLGGFVNTHRVFSVENSQGNLSFTTKGDANHGPDRYGVASKDLIGKVVYVSPVIGKAVRLLSNPLLFIPLVVLPLLLILVGNLIKTIKVARGIAREEEEAAVREALEEIKKRKKEM